MGSRVPSCLSVHVALGLGTASTSTATLTCVQGKCSSSEVGGQGLVMEEPEDFPQTARDSREKITRGTAAQFQLCRLALLGVLVSALVFPRQMLLKGWQGRVP